MPAAIREPVAVAVSPAAKHMLMRRVSSVFLYHFFKILESVWATIRDYVPRDRTLFRGIMVPLQLLDIQTV